MITPTEAISRGSILRSADTLEAALDLQIATKQWESGAKHTFDLAGHLDHRIVDEVARRYRKAGWVVIVDDNIVADRVMTQAPYLIEIKAP